MTDETGRDVHPLALFEFKKAQVLSTADSDPRGKVRLLTAAHSFGIPLIINDVFLRNFDKALRSGDLSPLARDIYVARSLIHASMHRAAQVQILENVTEKNPLVTLGFAKMAYYRDQLARLEPQKLNGFMEAVDTLRKYIQENGAIIVIDGARIYVEALDENGAPRILVDSGYDVTEDIVEYLVDAPADLLFKMHEKNFPTYRIRYGEQAQRTLQSVLKGKSTLESSTMYNNYMNQIEELFAKLGLKDYREALQAYSEGRIPQLFIEKVGIITSYFT